MKVLFSVCSWGLGHASRSLPLIKTIIEAGHRVTVLATGRSLSFLEKELGEKCRFIDLSDYSFSYPRGNHFVAKFISRTPLFLKDIAREHHRVKKLVEKEKFERIISDNRFGIYHEEIPSFFLSHQLRFIAPRRIKFLERIAEKFVHSFTEDFEKFLVPDFEFNSLSGDLSHNLQYYRKEEVEYIGIISDLKKREVEEDIDYFVSLSGPEPQRTILEEKVLSQIPQLSGKIVVALGKPEEESKAKKGNVTIYGFLPRRMQEEIMNRSKLIITRPGYTTLMEIALLGKKALLIPTPGQTEQVYLANYHMHRGNFYAVSQEELDLARDTEEAKKYRGFSFPQKKDGKEKFMEIVFGGKD